jgi:hypothetical protein
LCLKCLSADRVSDFITGNLVGLQGLVWGFHETSISDSELVVKSIPRVDDAAVEHPDRTHGGPLTTLLAVTTSIYIRESLEPQYGWYLAVQKAIAQVKARSYSLLPQYCATHEKSL